MGIIYEPPIPPQPCDHPDRPAARTLRPKTRYYCEHCEKVFVVLYDSGGDEFGGVAGNTWDRWPLTTGRGCALLALAVIAVAATIVYMICWW